MLWQTTTDIACEGPAQIVQGPVRDGLAAIRFHNALVKTLFAFRPAGKSPLASSEDQIAAVLPFLSVDDFECLRRTTCGLPFLVQAFFGDGWGWAPYSGEGGNTTVFVQQSVPRFPVADVTGSTPASPCHWNAETFTVPTAKGGTGPVQVVSCR